MDKRKAITTAQRYINTVGKKYEISRAFVFGSYAKGNYHTDSDIDVAVVMKNIDNLFDTQVDLLQLRKEDDLIIEPHTFREADFDTDDPLVSEILHTNVKLRIAG